MPQGFPSKIRYFVMVFGNTMDSHKTFMDHLKRSQKLHEVNSVNDSDVIFAFVPIVSRAGTDISAAMEKIPEGKPVVLVVLHHTFDQDYIAPNSKLCVNRENVFAVDCLFHEDQRLLRCSRNDEAIRAVKEHLIRDDCSEQAADENKRLLRNRSSDDANKATKKQQRSEDHIEVNPDYYRWIFLVVGIVVGVAVGIGVGVALGFGVNTSVGIAIGIIVGVGLIITVIVIWVQYYRQRCTCHTII